MVGAKAGLGYLITASQLNFQIPNMYAGIVAISLLGLTNQRDSGPDRTSALALARHHLTTHSRKDSANSCPNDNFI